MEDKLKELEKLMDAIERAEQIFPKSDVIRDILYDCRTEIREAKAILEERQVKLA